MVGKAMVFVVMCAGLLLMSCNNKNPASSGGAPAITTQPASQAVNEGSSVTFTVVATGDPAPTYQWQKNGVDISGATNATYTIASPVDTNSGTYQVVVVNSAGSVTSNAATLTVTPTNPTAPIIGTQPVSQTVNEGSAVVFTVVATGNPAPPNYQWRKDGVAISGATSATYGIGSVTQNDAGIYTVYVSNTQGNVTSNGALLIVNQGPEVLNYTVSGSTITVYQPQRLHFWTYCNGNTLVTGYDTSYAGTMSLYYNVSGNTLDLGMCDTQYQICDTAHFTRVGSGTTLIGTWIINTTSQDWPDTLVATATTVTAYGTNNNGNSCPADDYINYNWPGYSTGFNGTATKISCTQVTIHGNTSGETVTINWNNNGDMTYSSTNGAHAAYVYYNNPPTCPNNWTPDWWTTFINAN